jgi:tetratricopeptide (TPR) repeat protein
VMIAVLVSGLGGSTGPEVAKRKYVENGNSYFERQMYKQASLMYRNALKKDPRYGDAWYRLSLAQLELRDLTGAYGSLRRAVELDAENVDAKARLADILLGAYQSDRRNREQYQEEIRILLEDPEKGLLTRHAGSFEALRVEGAYRLIEASQEFELAETGARSQAEERRRKGDALLRAAVAKLREANDARPNEPGVVMTLAQSLATLNEFAEAEKLVKGLIAEQKDALLAYEFLFAQYALRNRPDDAEAILKQAVEANPQNDAMAIRLAAYYRVLKREEDASKVLAAYVDRAEDSAFARMRVGDFWIRVRDFDSARASYQAALEAKASSKPEAARNEIRKRIADALVAQDRKEEARMALEQILADNPDDPQARSMHAALLIEAGDAQQVAQAIGELEAAIGRAPRNAVLRYNLGRAYIVRKPAADFDKARLQLQEAIKLRPDYLAAHLLLAQLYLATSEFVAAEAQAKQALEYEPRGLAARELLARAQIGLRNFTAARANLDEVLKARPDLPSALYQLANLNLAEGRLEEAEAAFWKVHNATEADPAARGLTGIVQSYVRRKQGARAKQIVEQELAKNPNRMALRFLLANTSYMVGDLPAAQREFEKLVAENPDYGDLYARLGQVYRQTGEHEKAIATLKKASELMPSNAIPSLTLGILHESRGETQMARTAYNEVLRRDPNQPIALNNLAYLLAESGGDLDEALTLAQRAKQRLPDNDEISDTLGWIYIKKNLHDNAILIFQDLTKRQPRNPTFQYHLGMALFQKGDKPSARRALETALNNNPSKQEEQKIRDLIQRLG